MDWTQVLVIVGSNTVLMMTAMATSISLFLWNRSEARNDQAQIRDLIKEVQNEMKYFHGRLCTFEEKKKG